MAPTKGKSAVEFNAIINAGRERKKNEDLAKEIFGRNRRASAPGGGAGIVNRKSTVPSLASRIGIAKKPSSVRLPGASAKAQTSRPPAGNVNAEWTHDLHSHNNPPTGPRKNGRNAPNTRASRLEVALTTSASSPALNAQYKVVEPPARSISIRGLAGPYIVVAKNFAVGTTAADIESAFVPVGGQPIDTRLIAQRPNVIAEITFESKEGADNVVETFNKQSADGNILSVYHKIGGTPKPVAPPSGPRANVRSNGHRPEYNADRYPREESRESRRDPAHRGDFIDGSYGFDDEMEVDTGGNGDGGKANLYSDDLINKRAREGRPPRGDYGQRRGNYNGHR